MFWVLCAGANEKVRVIKRWKLHSVRYLPENTIEVMHALADSMERLFDNKPEVDNDPSSSSSDLPSHCSRPTTMTAHEDGSNSCVVKISVPQNFSLGTTEEALMAIENNINSTSSSSCATPESKQCRNSPQKHEETNETIISSERSVGKQSDQLEFLRHLYRKADPDYVQQ